MVDKDILFAKSSAVKKHLNRVEKHSGITLEKFLEDQDTQDIILFNLQMAVQNCIDIAAHIVSEEGLGVAGSTNEMFYYLEENGLLEQPLTEKMVKAAGLRNLIVHEYGTLDLARLYEVSRNDVNDLYEFLKTLFNAYG